MFFEREKRKTHVGVLKPAVPEGHRKVPEGFPEGSPEGFLHMSRKVAPHPEYVSLKQKSSPGGAQTRSEKYSG